MITGDHAGTASAIARAVGIANADAVLTGVALDQLDDEALAARAVEVDVYARTSPQHKLRLVEALQSRALIVAMTGDGVNDAPAVKRADIGIAMGRRGTEAAKEAAQMVLADDDFTSIAHAVEEGRIVYDNLQKAIQFILATNGAQALIIIVAVLLGAQLPITAVQILWVNMVTAVALSLALAFERAEADVMSRPPRSRSAPLLNGAMLWQIAFVSALILVGTFGIFEWQLRRGADIETARTSAVNTLVGFEIAYLFSARQWHRPAFGAARPGRHRAGADRRRPDRPAAGGLHLVDANAAPVPHPRPRPQHLRRHRAGVGGGAGAGRDRKGVVPRPPPISLSLPLSRKDEELLGRLCSRGKHREAATAGSDQHPATPDYSCQRRADKVSSPLVV